MLALTRYLAFDHHGLHVVVQHSARHATKVFERMIMALDQRLDDFHIHLVCDHDHFQNPVIFSKRCISFQSLHCVNLHPTATYLELGNYCGNLGGCGK